MNSKKLVWWIVDSLQQLISVVALGIVLWGSPSVVGTVADGDRYSVLVEWFTLCLSMFTALMWNRRHSDGSEMR